jgi:adenylate cyclase
MEQSDILAITDWIARAALDGEPEGTLFEGFCTRARDAGLPIVRAVTFIDTLHPVYEGRAVQWKAGEGLVKSTDYGRTVRGEALERWQQMPHYELRESGETLLRLTPAADARYDIIREVHAEGATDYLALIHRFAPAGSLGEMDCCYSSFMTDRPGGFTDAEVDLIRRLKPHLALGVKSVALRRVASTLVETYLGRDAGRRVLEGQIERGVADWIEAVLWFSDLRDFTRIADGCEPHAVIDLLNDYADAVVSSIHAHGGDVLKLMGDGVLAVFTAEGRCRAALDAAAEARVRVAELSDRRAEAGQPTTGLYLGLHLGEVFYGNIGSTERLDFTVVGPAVNEVSRIAALCRSLDQPVLLSSAFAAAVGEGPLVGVGRYALRGVKRPQELFTLEPEEAGSKAA